MPIYESVGLVKLVSTNLDSPYGMTSNEFNQRKQAWLNYLKTHPINDVRERIEVKNKLVKSGKEVKAAEDKPTTFSVEDPKLKYAELIPEKSFLDTVHTKFKENAGTILPAAALGLAGVGLYKYLKNKKKKQEEAAS